jgi:hypothetical protein
VSGRGGGARGASRVRAFTRQLATPHPPPSPPSPTLTVNPTQQRGR